MKPATATYNAVIQSCLKAGQFALSSKWLDEKSKVEQPIGFSAATPMFGGGNTGGGGLFGQNTG
eukprot:5633000-Karenia_brevis.AAC.1